MSDLARQYPIRAYLVLVYVIALVVLALPLLSSSGLGLLPIELPGAAPFILLAAVALAVAAFVVTRWADGPLARASFVRGFSVFESRPCGTSPH